ncbi:MAG: helix-turn-helix transcriptional regulator [Bacillota bacterium]
MKVIRKTYKIDPIKVRIARAVAGWSKQELAERAGIDRHTLAKIEKGKGKSINLGAVEKVAKALGKTIEDFVANENEQNNENHSL